MKLIFVDIDGTLTQPGENTPPDSALEAIADKALEKETGARALRAIIEEFMLDIMYEIPKDENIGRVTITRDYIEGKASPLIEIRGEAVQPKLPQFNTETATS